MEVTKRKAINDKLAKYDFIAKEDDFIEITEWSNKEGFDIYIYSNSNNKLISLTTGELEAIKCLVMNLNYSE